METTHRLTTARIYDAANATIDAARVTYGDDFADWLNDTLHADLSAALS